MSSSKFVELAEIFQDRMILQRGKPVKVWGTSAKAQTLTVLLDGEKICEVEVSAGEFVLMLPAQEAAEDRTLTISNGEGESVALRNVDFGEVWIAGGQSNMEFALLTERNGDAVIAAADDAHFRYYEVGKYAFEGEREEHLKVDHRWNHWRRFVTDECTHFSAVATYYAMELRKELQVPVGIIGCCWGGTTASTWMDEKLVREDPELKVYTDTYDKDTANLNLEKYIKSDRKNRAFMGSEKNTVGAEQVMKNEVTAPMKFPMRQIMQIMIRMQKLGPHSENRPGGLYQTMVKKIGGYSAKGVIWYQGESDDHHPDLYARLFAKMIGCWRGLWQDELPFLFVQLAPWEEWNSMTGVNYPKVRDQQQYVEDHVPGTHMVSIMDAGSRYDIHPKDKTPVGHRLCLMALEEVYGMPQAYAHAPRIAKAQRSGNLITLTFRYAEGGLRADGDISGLFAVTQNGKAIAVSAAVNGEQVILTCSGLQEGKAEVSFAYVPYLKMNLFNQGGLPARPLAPTEVL